MGALSVTIAATLWIAGALLLVVGGALHLARPLPLQRALTRTGLVSVPLSVPAARLWGVVETAVGGAALAALLLDGPTRAAAVATTAVFGAFTLYLRRARRNHGGADCACIGSGTALDGSVIARAVAFTAAGAVVAIGVPSPPVAPTVAMAAVLALLAWLVPAALHPADDPLYGSSSAAQPTGVPG